MTVRRFSGWVVQALLLAVLFMGCGGANFCPECDKNTPVQKLDYQPAPAYTAGSAITVLPPNPAGGTPTAYAVTSGALPVGLILNPTTGIITGTPTTPGVYNITVQASNGANQTVQTFTLTVAPTGALGVSYATPSEFTEGSPIPDQRPSFVNDTPGLASTFAVTSGALPAGLRLGTDGTISGTPTTPAAPTTLTVQATNGTRTASASMTYTVAPAAALSLGYSTPQVFLVGSSVPTQSPTLGNLTPGVRPSYAITAGALPAGLALNPNSGEITGIPLTAGVFSFTTALTQGARSATIRLTYTVTPASPLVVSYATGAVPQSVAIATRVPAIAQQTPGVPITYSLMSGSLPPGLSLNAQTGEITGIPTTPGVYGFMVLATNGTRTATASASITVLPPPTAALAATNARAVPSPASPLFGDPDVTVTPTFAGASSVVVGTSIGASDISASPSSGTPIPVQPTGFKVSTTYYLRATNATGVATDASVAIQPQSVSVATPTPSAATLGGGSQTTFSTTTTGGYLGTVTWSVAKGTNASAGTMNSATGAWTAPASLGTVTVTATSVDDPTKTASTTVSVVANPSLTATLSVVKHGTSVNSAAPGDTLDYTAVVTNTGGLPATGVAFNLAPGANLSLLGGSNTSTTAGSVTTGAHAGDTSVAVALGTLAPNASATITFSMAVASVVPAGTTSVSAQGSVSGTNAQTSATDDPTTATVGDASLTPLTGAPVLSIQKSAVVDGGGALAPGGTITYAISIRNAGPYTVSGAALTDTMPANTTYVASSASATSGTPAFNNNALSVTGITIPGHSEVLVSFRVKVADTLPSGTTQISNQGSLAYDPTGSGTNDHTLSTDGDGSGGPTLTSVVAGPAFDSLAMGVVLQSDVDTDQEYSPGDTVRYTVTIPNTGNQNATGITFTDVLPAQITYVAGSATASAGSAPIVAGGTLTWTGDVAAGTSVVLTFDASINQGVIPGTAVDNQGTLAYATRGSGAHDATMLTDGDLSSVGKQTTTFILEIAPAPTAIMSVVNTDPTHNTAHPGDILTYTVVLTNIDDDYSLPGVTYTNLIPANTTYVPSSLSAVLTGTSTPAGSVSASGNPVSLGWMGTLPMSGGVTLAYQVQVNNALAPSVTQIVNQGTLTYSPTGSSTSSLQTDGDPTVLGAQTTTLPVVAVPSGSLSAGSSTISSGCSTTLTWSSQDATSASIDQGVGSLSLGSGSGSVTVSPTTTTTYTLTLTGPGGTSTFTTTVTVDPAPSISAFSVSPSTPAAGASLTFSATFSGGNGIITPGNLSITSGGTASLNPGPGSTTSYTLTVTAPCGTSSQATSSVTATIISAALTVSYTTPKFFTRNTAITSQSPTINNATPGVSTTYAHTSGTLPTGLSIDTSTGVISGTPSAMGVSTFVITATNGSQTATATLTYTIESEATFGVSYVTPKIFTSGSAISTQSATLSNATTGVSTGYALTSGSLPAGLSLNTSTGDITGAPAATGVSTFSITATNGSRSAGTSLSYTVTAEPLSLSYATPMTFINNAAISTQNPTVTNLTSGVTATYTLASGSLPSGLSLNTSTGAITGTPSGTGTYPFTITLTNGTNASGNTRSSTASVSYTIANASLGYGTPKVYVEQVAISANNPSPVGISPNSYAITLGTLPTGLSLNTSTGAITGTPTAVTAGAVSVTITGTQTSPSNTASQVLSITVGPSAPTALGYSTPVTYTNGTAITANAPHPTGGTPSSYQVTSGVLPAGLSIDPSTGIISGTPTATSSAVSVTITGSNVTGTAAQTLSITVNGAAPTALNYATPVTYTNGTPIVPNNPNPTGGTPSSYSVSPALPAGLVLNTTTGVISGTPTANVTSVTYTVTGTNATGSASKAIVITVSAAAPVALHYSTPVVYAVGETVVNDPNPEGGTPTSYSYTGTLPAGLSFSTSTGIISGSPTASLAGPTYAVTLTITGTNGTAVSQSVTITVPPPVVAHFSANPLTLPVGQSAGLSPVYSGGNGTVNQGIGAVNSGAVTNVTSASAGSTTYTLTVTNSYNQSATATVTVTWVTQSTQIDLLIPADGGVSSTDVSDSSSALYGVKVVVPTFPSGDCGSTHLVIYPDANALPSGATLPTGLRACSPTFDFTTTAGYPFRLPITVTLPYTTALTSPTATLTSSDVPVPFYWDPTYSKWVACGIKSIDTSAHRVTFTTLLPGLYTVLVVPGLSSSLSGSTVSSTGWVATTDGWFQPNQGTYENPGGSSFGMSAFASWYFGQAKYNATTNPSSPYNAGLYSMFRQGALASDDVNARALISRLANGTLESWGQLYSQSNYTLTDLQTGLAFITALKATAQPQLFLMGDARPALSNALATLITNFTYSSSTSSTFSVMDPNYPGTALTITWNPTTGAFTAYDRAAGYIPAFVKYAFEGHTSVHRLADYERALSGANTGWLNPPFAAINLSQVGDITPVTLDGSTLQVANSSSVTLTGTITNGDAASQAIYWSQNGGTRTAVNLNGGTSFSFSIGALVNPFATRVMLETSPNACDSTFGRTGFQEFWIKDRALVDWFINSCFEKGLQADNITPIGWTLSQGSNNGVAYNYPLTWDRTGNPTNFTINWNVTPADSGQVTLGADPKVSAIRMVLDGATAYRLNNAATGAHISRLTQTVTVPTTVAEPSLAFSWAAILDNPSHPATDQPFVDIWIQDFTDPNNVTTLYYKHFYANDPSYPGWLTGTGTWLGIPWQKVSLTDLSNLKGHSLKITIIAADCNQTGHGGYMYIDNVACN